MLVATARSGVPNCGVPSGVPRYCVPEPWQPARPLRSKMWIVKLAPAIIPGRTLISAREKRKQSRPTQSLLNERRVAMLAPAPH